MKRLWVFLLACILMLGCPAFAVLAQEDEEETDLAAREEWDRVYGDVLNGLDFSQMDSALNGLGEPGVPASGRQRPGSGNEGLSGRAEAGHLGHFKADLRLGGGCLPQERRHSAPNSAPGGDQRHTGSVETLLFLTGGGGCRGYGVLSIDHRNPSSASLFGGRGGPGRHRRHEWRHQRGVSHPAAASYRDGRKYVRGSIFTGHGGAYRRYRVVH